MTRADLRYDAHGAHKKLKLEFSARRKGTGSRDRWGETSLGRLQQDRFPKNSELSEHFHRCDVGFGYSVSISYTSYPRRDPCFAAALVGRRQLAVA